jgi:hypothetical protein
VKRQRATQLAEQLLNVLGTRGEEWPLSIVTEVYVFGSYSRGATDPHNLDIEVEINRHDDRWIGHFAGCLSYGRDPYTIIRRALVGAARSYQFLFEARDRVDFPLTLLWRHGDPDTAALARLHAIGVDDTAGRAPHDAMLPQFQGLDRGSPVRTANASPPRSTPARSPCTASNYPTRLCTTRPPRTTWTGGGCRPARSTAPDTPCWPTSKTAASTSPGSPARP